MTTQVVQDWTGLTVRRIEIRQHGKTIDGGVVDLVADDGTVLWLAPDGANSRRLYARAEGYDVRVVEASAASTM